MLSPAKRRQTVAYVREALGRETVSERRACKVLGQPRSTQRRARHVPHIARLTREQFDDEPRLGTTAGNHGWEPRLVKRMVELATQYGRYGDRRITAMLRREAKAAADR